MNQHLRDDHFIALSRLIEQHVGIQLPASKRLMIEGRLQRRVRALGLSDVTAYGDALFRKGLLESEFATLIDCATTNKTDFFREPDHFDFLRDQAVPRLFADGEPRSRLLKVWSAASSTGAEAYTIAMVLASMQDIRFAILGTDVCTTVVMQARAAIYPAEMVATVPAPMRERFVMRSVDPARDEVRIVPELRARCHFDLFNLMDESYAIDRDVDVIFCRNVLIYFAKAVQQAVLARLSSHLRPGGYLILGHSETFASAGGASMVQVRPTIFQRAIGSAVGRRAA